LPLSEAEIREGFSCGAANPYKFNWIIQELQSAINGIDVTGGVDPNRKFEATEGIQGGGDMTADRLFRLHINGLELETSIANDDLIAIYDVSTGAHRAMTRANFVAGLTSGGGGGGSVIGAIDGAINIGGAPGELFASLDGTSLEFRTIAPGT